MRNVRDVYKKLREVKYRYLVILYKRYIKRAPDFCKFNRQFRMQTDDKVRFIRLCMLHQSEKGIVPHLLDVCEEVGHCTECNAFVCKHTKESVREMFENQLKDPKIKGKLYPEVTVLEWVLEQNAAGVPIIGWYKRMLIFIKNLFR